MFAIAPCCDDIRAATKRCGGIGVLLRIWHDHACGPLAQSATVLVFLPTYLMLEVLHSPPAHRRPRRGAAGQVPSPRIRVRGVCLFRPRRCRLLRSRWLLCAPGPKRHSAESSRSHPRWWQLGARIGEIDWFHLIPHQWRPATRNRPPLLPGRQKTDFQSQCSRWQWQRWQAA